MAGKLDRRRTQAERRATTRAALLNAAERLIAERGYHRASLLDIARAAGYSKGAVFHHFQSKDDLLLALLADRLASQREAVARVANEPVEEAPRALIAQVPFDPTWNLLFLEFAMRATRDPRFRRQFRRRLASLRSESARTIQRLLETHEIEPALSPADLAAAVAAIANGLAIEGLTDPSTTPDPLFAKILDLLLAGLRATSGPPTTAHPVGGETR